jgi:hypothetical protein
MERDSRWTEIRCSSLILVCFVLILAGCNRSPATPASLPTTNAGESPENAPSPSSVASDSTAPATETEKDSGTTSTPSKSSDSKVPSTTDSHHEPLFVGWPKPQIVFLITGQQMGYIEPCGCTGLTNQKGGLARRHTLAKELADRGWPVVPIDVGNQVRRFGRQSEIKFQRTGDALKKIGYKAVALGADDLRLSVGELADQTLPSEGQPSPFLSANAAVVDPTLTTTHQIVEIGGKKVGITSVVSEEWQQKIIGNDIILKSPDAGLDELLPKLRDAKCDVMVLLVQGSLDESIRLAQKYRDFQIVVTAGGGASEPKFQPEPIPDTNAILVEVGMKGMFAGVVGVFDDAKQPLRYQRVPLDSRFADSPDMLTLLAAYQDQLRELGLDALGLKPVPHPSGKRFVGSEKCGECHTKADAIWKESGHAHATESLVHPKERSEIARHFDPECLSCHVTGWYPQQFLPYESGYLNLEKTPMMKGSGCENCHGPGSAHVAAEEGVGNPSPDALTSLRESMRLPLSQAEKKCQECHDLDNSPDFHATGAFEKYWKKVEHIGKD